MKTIWAHYNRNLPVFERSWRSKVAPWKIGADRRHRTTNLQIPPHTLVSPEALPHGGDLSAGVQCCQILFYRCLFWMDFDLWPLGDTFPDRSWSSVDGSRPMCRPAGRTCRPDPCSTSLAVKNKAPWFIDIHKIWGCFTRHMNLDFFSLIKGNHI